MTAAAGLPAAAVTDAGAAAGAEAAAAGLTARAAETTLGLAITIDSIRAAGNAEIRPVAAAAVRVRSGPIDNGEVAVSSGTVPAVGF